jgi:hypothetical protein
MSKREFLREHRAIARQLDVRHDTVRGVAARLGLPPRVYVEPRAL